MDIEGLMNSDDYEQYDKEVVTEKASQTPPTKLIKQTSSGLKVSVPKTIKKASTNSFQGIRIKGMAQEKVNDGLAQAKDLKSAIQAHEHARKRLRHYEEYKNNLFFNVILPQMTEELQIIKRNNTAKAQYDEKKQKYVRQFFSNKRERISRIFDRDDLNPSPTT
ncbi:hypothetical protein MBANPS3_012534, partial [Mucor bainieri]